MASQSKQIISNINAVQQLPDAEVVGQFVEQEKHCACATQHFLSIDIMSTVTETTNVFPKKDSFWKKYKAAWLFWSKPSSNYAVLMAAIYCVRGLRKQVKAMKLRDIPEDLIFSNTAVRMSNLTQTYAAYFITEIQIL